jgi:hypothetical protein
MFDFPIASVTVKAANRTPRRQIDRLNICFTAHQHTEAIIANKHVFYVARLYFDSPLGTGRHPCYPGTNVPTERTAVLATPGELQYSFKIFVLESGLTWQSAHISNGGGGSSTSRARNMADGRNVGGLIRHSVDSAAPNKF